jgi:endonuclease/exonuclease/phosphatase (EEP) superfamily protein YafD
VVYHKDRSSPFFRTTVAAKSNTEFTILYDIFFIPGMSDRLHLISICRSPHPASLTSFLQHLEDFLHLQQRLRMSADSPFLLCGDFNIDLLQTSTDPDKESLLLSSYALYHYVQVHTSDFGSMLDHVWSNIPPLRLQVSMQESFWSDHVPILVSLSF